MRVFGLHPAPLAATALLLLAGCGGVTLEHPLSDDKTTAVDEQLIGYWELVPESVGEETAGPGERWPRIAVGRKKGDDRAMEAVGLQLEDGYVKVSRLDVRPTRIGDQRYLSLRNPEEAEQGWFVIRYRFDDDGRMHGRVLDPEASAASVDAGDVQGEVKSPDRGHDVAALTVEIHATTAEVRAWIEKKGDGLFAGKDAVLRRLVDKTSSDDADAAEPAEPDAPEPPGPPGPPEPDGDPDD